MNDPLRPLAPEIEALLRSERDAAPPSDDVRARLRTRVQATIAGGAATGLLASKSAAAKSVATKSLLGAAAVKVGVVTSALAIAAVTIAVVATHRPGVTAPTIAAPVIAPAPVVAPALAVPPTLEAPPVKASAPLVEHHRDPASHLRQEQALLARAHDALAAHDVPRALTALSQHARTFPTGQLAEERECLRARALAESGATTEAEAARAAFVAHYPHSLFPAASCGGRDGND